jgi:predicted Zn-dependent protease
MKRLIESLALSGLIVTAVPVPASAQAPVDDAARLPGVPFEELSRRAEEAVTGGRLDEAMRFYRAGLALNPLWKDGWWRLALIHFDAGRYADTRAALLELVRLEPDSGPPWALLGLSQFKLAAWDDALASLSRAVALGVPEGEAIGREALHHQALLLVRAGRFAEASQQLFRLVLLEPDDPELVMACGLMGLHRRLLPAEVAAAEQGVVALAGRATYAALGSRDAEARQLFRELIARYPRERGVHYVAGLYLSRNASGEGLPLLRQEVELFPDHVEAQLEIAYEILDRGDAKEALPFARAAARLTPELAAAHLVLGRALVATGALEQGIAELEESARRDPDVREVQLALAQAYAKAGRVADVQRAREKLLELEAHRGAH